jgi:transcription initiation factor TFIID TATA-box-binding protein
MTDIIIENIVAFAQVSNSFDVEMISEKMPGSSYNPDEFVGLTMKFDKPKVAVLVLSNGKIICTGSKNAEEVDISFKKAVKKIKDAGFGVKKNYKIKIDNVVASTDFKKKLDLEKASKKLPLQKVEYEPEDFPGLIYKADDRGTLLLLFSSGKVISTGANKIEDAADSIKSLEKKLTTIGVL